MPWVPQTDFEEEVVNLQPHHDFIYGALSEPEFSYPRPKAHVQYAATKNINNKQHQNEYGTSKINEKLRTMQQIQRMAGTKPLGEHAALEDWENNDNNEKETIGMMRYCGMGVSVEQPLNEKVTISTYPVDNTIKVVQNGRRKVALFFDDNVFKFQEKVSDTSSEFESCKTTEAPDDSCESQNDMSFNTSSSRSLKSNTGEEFSDSFCSAYSSKKEPSTNANYEKLLEDTSLLSLNSSGADSRNSSKQNSFKTAEEINFWKPYYECDEENMLSDKLRWPTLSKEDTESDTNELNGSITDVCNEENNCNNSKRENFLCRFIKSEESETLDSTSESTSAKSSKELKTYASIVKTSKVTATSSSKEKKKKDTSSDLIRDFPPFYTTRKMYALKRNVK